MASGNQRWGGNSALRWAGPGALAAAGVLAALLAALAWLPSALFPQARPPTVAAIRTFMAAVVIMISAATGLAGGVHRNRRELGWGLWSVLLIAAAVAVSLVVWRVPPALYATIPVEHGRAQAIALTRTGVLTAAAGLLVLANLLENRRSTNLTHTRELAEQLTDRYTAAVAQLGSDTLDVRLGGIYAFERIAKDSAPDHRTVVEVLSAFVREHTIPGRPGAARRNQHTDPSTNRAGRAADPAPAPAPAGPDTDIQAALNVLGRLPIRADITRADITGAYLGNAQMDRAKLAGAQMAGANLTGAQLLGADLAGANLAGADLTGAQMNEADLTGANLTGAGLSGAGLSGAGLSGARLSRANLAGVRLASANLAGAQLVGANLTGAQMSGANLTGTQMTGANLTEAKLNGANFADANLNGADLAGANLADAKLTGANIAHGGLLEADLSRADLAGAHLVGAILVGANLADAVLAGANLAGADLDTVTGLTAEQLGAATVDGSTVLPEELTQSQQKKSDA